MIMINTKDCELVQDLLPLYQDKVCSDSSAAFVEEHLKHCEKCRQLSEKVKKHEVEDIISSESNGVLARHSLKEKSAAWKAGLIIGGLLLLPILITLIVVISTGKNPGVLGVLTASMLLVAALTVLPLMSSCNRLSKSLFFGSLSIILIMFFTDLMEGGGNFLYWAVPTVFGLSVPFFPIIIHGAKLPACLSGHKTLISLLWDSIWLYLTIIEVCLHNGNMEGLKEGVIVASLCLIPLWIIVLTARYLPVNPWFKASIGVLVFGAAFAFINDAYGLIAYGKQELCILNANFLNWNCDTCINGNIFLIVLITGVVASLTFLAVGIYTEKLKKNQEKNKQEKKPE